MSYDTIEESVTWTEKLCGQLNLARVARNKKNIYIARQRLLRYRYKIREGSSEGRNTIEEIIFLSLEWNAEGVIDDQSEGGDWWVVRWYAQNGVNQDERVLPVDWTEIRLCR